MNLLQIISPLRIKEQRSVAEYEESVRELLDFQETSLSSYELSVGQHMAAYKSYLEEQRFLQVNSLDVKILSRALNGFSDLEDLCIDYTDDHIGVQELMKAFGVMRGGDILTYNCEYTLPVIFRALSASKAEIKSLRFGNAMGTAEPFDSSPFLKDAPFASYGSALPHGGSVLTSPRPQTSPSSQNHCEKMSVRAMSETFLTNGDGGARYALRGLQELEIGGMEDCDTHSSMSVLMGSILFLIGRAPFLTSVTFGPTYSHINPTMRGVFSYHYLRYLRKLDLHDFHTKESHLVDFFRHHSVTLVDVSFSNMTVTDSDWSKVLTHLRKVPFPALEDFLLSYCIEHIEGECWVDDYVLQKTDKNPAIEISEEVEE